MDTDLQVMETVSVPVELYIHITCQDEVDPRPDVLGNVPYMCRIWIESQIKREFVLSPEEKPMVPERVERKMEFEVLLDINSVGRAYKANCQTVCPVFVAAWIEIEAIKQYNKERSL